MSPVVRAVRLTFLWVLRQLWQGLPFLSQILYMRRMLLCRKSSLLLERAGNRRNFALRNRENRLHLSKEPKEFRAISSGSGFE